MKFRPYQSLVINDKSKLKIINKSRDIGMSTTLAFMALQGALKGKNQLLISSSEFQSKNLMLEVKKFVSYYKKKYNIQSKDTDNVSTITVNGKQIVCHAPNANTIRGFKGDVTLDEYAFFVGKDKEIYTAISGIISNPNFNLIISSTPYGMNNKFYEIFNGAKTKSNELFKEFKWFEIPLNIAEKYGYVVDMKVVNSYADFERDQEYYCKFIDEATSYFPRSLFDPYVLPYDYTTTNGDLYIGIDIAGGAGGGDSTAIVRIMVENNIKIVKSIEMFNDKKLPEQQTYISNIISNEKPKKVFLDRTGNGQQISQYLTEHHPNIVTGISFGVENKGDMVTYTKSELQAGHCKFNINDPNTKRLITQLHTITPKFTATSMSFDVKRTKEGHGDAAIAYLLSVLATKNVVLDPFVLVI